jgi:hypothetical protein
MNRFDPIKGDAMDVAITIDPERWREVLRPRAKEAGILVRRGLAMWMEIAALTVEGKGAIFWRGLLADLKDQCEKDADPDLECPYGVQYLYEMAVAYSKMATAKRTFDDFPGVPTAVFILGRELPDLFEQLDKNPNMTVSRIKALVKFRNDPENIAVEPEDVERRLIAIEEEQSRKRKQPRTSRGYRKIDSPEELAEALGELSSTLDGLGDAIVRLRTRGTEFNVEDIAVARSDVQRFDSVLAEVEPAHT